MINEKLQIQYEIMTDENKDEYGNYIPSYDKLIAEAPNEDMKKEWKFCEELFERVAEDFEKSKGFVFRCVYMFQLSCGHYTIYQHAVPDDWSVEECEESLFKFVEEVDIPDKRKCLNCM